MCTFSSPGIGGASQQDVTNQLQRAPTTPLQQLEQDIAVEESKLGQGASPRDVAAAVQKLLNDFAEQALMPEFDKAVKPGASYELFWQALDDLFAWKRFADLRGLEATDFEKLLEKWKSEAPRVLKDKVNACFQKHDVFAGLFILYKLRLLTILGIDLGTELDAIFRCLRFKLDFDTQLHSQDSSSFSISSHVAANAVRPIAIGQGGSAPLNYISFDWQTAADAALAAGGCAKSSETRVTDDFRVIGMQGLDLDTEGGKKWQLTDFFLNLTPGKALETLTVTCPQGGPQGGRSGEAHYYNDNWETLHRDEHVERASGSYFAISGWSIQNGNVLFAQKTYNRTGHYANVTVMEATALKLWHDPEGTGFS